MRRLSVQNRLLCAFLLVVGVSLAAAGTLIDHVVNRTAFDQVEERLRYEVTMTSQMVASALFAPLELGDNSLQGPVSELSKAVRTHLSVLTPAGSVAADSEGRLGAGSGGLDPEFLQALRERKGAAVRGDGAARQLWVAESVVRDGRVLGVVRASVPMTIVEAQAIAVRRRVLLAAFGALLLGALVAMGVALGISRPIRRLAEAARRIGSGDLDVNVNEPVGDEIGELGRALNDMSRNLKDNLFELDTRNADMRRVLDSIDQGIVVVRMDGSIEGERSARLDTWFRSPAPGIPIWQIFESAAPAVRDSFASAWGQLVDAFLPLELLLDQLPKRIVDGERTYGLAFAAISEGEDCKRLLVVISDVTILAAGERKDAEQKDLLGILGRSIRDRSGVLEFLQEADVLVARLTPSASLVDVKRFVHTLKGNSAIHGVLGIATLCHDLESRIAEEGAVSEHGCAVLRERWHAFRESVDAFLGSRAGIVLDEVELEQVIRALVSGENRGSVVQRMASWTLSPVEASLRAIGDRAKSLAERLGKGRLLIHIEHDGTRIDRDAWAPLWSSLIHAVRNAVDHGIEPPEERRLTNKGQPTLKLTAQHVNEHFCVEVSDDGRGIDWEQLARKLRDNGLPHETKDDLIEGLFADGLSTAAALSDISGRGVGMGALRDTVRALGGTIGVKSIDGQGTTIICRFAGVQAELARRIAQLGDVLPSIKPGPNSVREALRAAVG